MTNQSYDGIQKQVFSFLEGFKPFFSRAEFDSFVLFIFGLLSDTRNKTVAGIARLDGLKDHTILSKFLQSKNLGKISLALRELFFNKADWNRPFTLYIDDSLVEKSGKIVRAEYNYSSTLGKTIPSNCFVVGLAKNGSLSLPFDFAKYYKKSNPFKSKIDLALAMTRSFLRRTQKASKKVFVFDSWYACKKLVKLVRDANAFFVTRLKSNRKLRARKGKRSQTLAQYAECLGARKFKKTRLSNGKVFYVFSQELCVNKVGRVKVVFSRAKKQRSQDRVSCNQRC